MPKKNGFIAVSVIYSFFLVFLMIMLANATKNAQTRSLLTTMKDDIKANLNMDSGFIVTNVPKKKENDYQVGEEINLVGESWLVVENKTDTIVLILKRALNNTEITEALGLEQTNTHYFNSACNETSCKVRMCLTEYSNNYCFVESSSNFYPYDWDNSIAKRIIENWLDNNANLQKICRLQYDETLNRRVCTKNTLIWMNFQNSAKEYHGYIRIPTKEEAEIGKNTWVKNNGGYLATEAWTLSSESPVAGASRIYDIGGNLLTNEEVKTIRPVIEVQKN